MSEEARPHQLADQLIDISGWVTNDEFGAFPGGSKPKRSVICPDPAPFPFLIPGHAYLFKTALEWRVQQIWSEIVAYRISHLCGVQVPPCWAAIDGGVQGVLIEFFYGYAEERPTRRLVHGTDLMQQLYGPRYDAVKGRPHTLGRIIFMCRGFRVPNPIEWWAKTLMFDGLIGNMDRHAQNWGLLRDSNDQWTMAPAYDNGTSLGYMFPDAVVEAGISDQDFRDHIDGGRHHITKDDSMAKHGDGFVTLCLHLCTIYPSAKSVVARLLPTPDAPIRELIEPLTRFDSPVRFTQHRAAFVERLIRARRDILAQALGV